jgi:O-antigen/teichoic acid export membrane protein
MGVAATNSGTASAAIKFVAEVRGAGTPELVRPVVAYLKRAQRRFLLVVLVVGAFLLWLAGPHVSPEFHHGWLFLFLTVAVALRAGYMFNIGVAKGLEDFRINATVALVASPLNLAMVLIAIWLEWPVEWLLCVFIASGLIFYGMSLVQVRRLLPPGEDRPLLPDALVPRVRRQMRYAALIVTVAFLVGSELEVVLLTALSDPHDAGQFKVGYQLAAGASALVPGVFGALLLPMMANAISQGREVAGRRFAASTGYLALLSAPLVAFGAALAEPLIALLYGAAYAPAALVFAVCLTGLAITALTQGASSLLISADRQRLVLVQVVVCALLKVGLGALLIHLYGLRGALMAFAVVTLFNTVSLLWLAIVESGASPEWSRLLRTALAAALAAVPVVLLRDVLPVVAELALGAALGAAVYFPLTLWFGCWNANDIAYMQQLHRRLLRGQPRFGARLLAWAHARATLRVEARA